MKILLITLFSLGCCYSTMTDNTIKDHNIKSRILKSYDTPIESFITEKSDHLFINLEEVNKNYSFQNIDLSGTPNQYHIKQRHLKR
jgi:hypothetical protein